MSDNREGFAPEGASSGRATRPEPTGGSPPAGERRRGRSFEAVLAWASLVVVAIGTGRLVLGNGRSVLILFPPFAGQLAPRFGVRGIIPVVVGAAIVLCGPELTRRLSWGWLMVVAMAAAGAWALSLAWVDGTHALVQGLANRTDYLAQVRILPPPAEFVRTFVRRILDYRTQVRGHPPGFVVLLWSMNRIGLGGATAEAWLVIAAGASSVPAVLIALRDVAGEDRARRTAPFLAAAPMAVTVASSADALYLGVGAWAVALIVLATGRRGLSSDGLALSGGLLFGAGLFLSYGLAPLGLVFLVVAVDRRRVRPLVVAGAGIVTVVIGFALAGFWLLAGLVRTRRLYNHTMGALRPYGYFVFADLAVLAVMVGPAVAAALGRGPSRTQLLLAAGGFAAVLVADLSGLSKGEVERIWLPFAPWLITSCAAFEGDRSTQGWLAANVATGVAFELLIRSPF